MCLSATGERQQLAPSFWSIVRLEYFAPASSGGDSEAGARPGRQRLRTSSPAPVAELRRHPTRTTPALAVFRAPRGWWPPGYLDLR